VDVDMGGLPLEMVLDQVALLGTEVVGGPSLARASRDWSASVAHPGVRGTDPPASNTARRTQPATTVGARSATWSSTISSGSPPMSTFHSCR